MADTAPLVIVGTGLAGYNLAKEFRKLDNQRPMLLVSADDGRFYSKPLLSTGFSKGKEADELAMQDAAAMAAQIGAEVLTGVPVSAINPAERTLTLGDREQAYSDLVLALGAEVRALPWREQLGERLLSINDLADYGRFRAALTGRKKVLIIGAGLIGCEFANDLSLGGFEVTVVATDPWLMPQLLPEPVAACLAHGLSGATGLVVVFDLGAGTFDVSVVSLGSDGDVEVIATSGDAHLGGNDFDAALVQWLGDEFGARGAGSLNSYLKGTGLASGVSLSVEESTRTFVVLGVEIGLTKLGLERWPEVCAALFAYRRMLLSGGVPAHVYTDAARLRELNFRFGEPPPPQAWATATVGALDAYAPT